MRRLVPERSSLPLDTLFALLFCLLLGACGGDEPPRPELPPGQLVETLILGEPKVPPLRQYPGRVEATREALLAFQVAGPLVERPANEGMMVEKGALLARIDPRDFETALRAQQATVLEAEQQFQRVSELLGSGAVTEAQFEEVQARYEIASAELRQAEKNLADTELRAPFAGRIAEVYVENFENVQARQRILLLHDISQLDVVIQVPEQDLASLSPDTLQLGIPAGEVRFNAIPEQRFPVTLREFRSRADPETQTYRVTLTLPAPEDRQILPGMSATYFPPGTGAERRQIFRVPVTAVVADPQRQPHVFLVDTETMAARRRDVDLGQPTGDNIEILGGLEPGDAVITRGAVYLADGSPIRLR